MPRRGANLGNLDRYMLGQLIRLFGFFGLVLVGLVWVNRSVALFDRLLGDGHNVGIFFELSLLSLPELIAITLPLAAFAAGATMANRMSGDSEIIAARAAGLAPLRIARAPAAFGLMVLGLMLVLTHWLVPASHERRIAREAEIARDQTARLLTPGQFAQVDQGVTLFFRGFADPSTMRDVFVQDEREPGRTLTYSAPLARLVSTRSGPQLVLLEGALQSLDGETGRMIVTRFDEARYDLALLLPDPEAQARPVTIIRTGELLGASAALRAETGESASQLRAHGHIRNAQAALGMLAGLIGFLPLLLGAHSRFGHGPQILAAIGLVVLVMLADSAGRSIGRSIEGPWAAVYAAPACAAAIIAGLAALLYWPARAPKVRPC